MTAPDLNAAVAQLVDARLAQLGLAAGVAADELLVSTTEAGRRLGVGRDKVVELCEVGELTYVQGLGRGRLVTIESLRAYVSRHVTDHRRRRHIGRVS